MPFFNLLILEVADHISDSAVSSLARTCWSLNRLLNSYLYARDMKTGYPEALRWAIEKLEVATAKLSLDTCPDIDHIFCQSGRRLTGTSPLVTMAVDRWGRYGVSSLSSATYQ
jgi:hypothetical protein